MIRRPHPVLRFALLSLFALVGLRLFFSILDMPGPELQDGALASLQATLALLALAVGCYLCYLPRLRVGFTDGCAALLFAGLTLWRFCAPDAVGIVRYDDLLQATLLYAALRILFLAERRMSTVMFVLLCVLGIYEAWIGIGQICGWAASNHCLFRVTGTFFNPGPYAGFLAPIFVCAVARIVRHDRLIGRVWRAWATERSVRFGVIAWGVVPYLFGWAAALAIPVVLAASVSRAAWVAVLGACGLLVWREYRLGVRLRMRWRCRPLRTAAGMIGAGVLILAVAAGCYCLKRPSADGRLLMWKIDLRVLLQRPLCGVGPGNFAGAFGQEQARYFAAKERSQTEIRCAGCPESGFNEFLRFGGETGCGGLLVLLVMTGGAVAGQVRRGSAFGYGLLAAALFACFSYPWSVPALRVLFLVLLAGPGAERLLRMHGRRHLLVVTLLGGCVACWPGLYERSTLRDDARKQWDATRVWAETEHFDYLIEDGRHLLQSLQSDFRFLYAYGYALHKAGRYRCSNEVLALGMRISSDPMFWNITGRNHEALGDVSAAEKAYWQAYYRVPGRLYPLYRLAKCYAASGRPEQAREVARRAVADSPRIETVQTRRMQEELRALLNETE